MLAEELGRRLALAVGGPGAVAELHGRPGGLQAGQDAAQLLALARPRDDVGRQLHQDGAQLVAERPVASTRASMTASRSSRLGRRMRPRLSSWAGSSRSGGGRRPGSDGCPEMTW